MTASRARDLLVVAAGMTAGVVLGWGARDTGAPRPAPAPTSTTTSTTIAAVRCGAAWTDPIEAHRIGCERRKP